MKKFARSLIKWLMKSHIDKWPNTGWVLGNRSIFFKGNPYKFGRWYWYHCKIKAQIILYSVKFSSPDTVEIWIPPWRSSSNGSRWEKSLWAASYSGKSSILLESTISWDDITFWRTLSWLEDLARAALARSCRSLNVSTLTIMVGSKNRFLE